MMLTALYSLEELTADDLRWQREPTDGRPHVTCSPIGPRELALLAELLGCGDHHNLLAHMRLLAGESQESPWVVAIPERVASAIGRIRGGEMAFRSAQWRAASELTSAFETHRLEQLLSEMVRFLQSHEGPFAMLVVMDS